VSEKEMVKESDEKSFGFERPKIKIMMPLSGLHLVYDSRLYKIVSKIERFIIYHFVPRKCYCCTCGDCQLRADGREYWYCLHFKNNICLICCVFDSVGENYKECSICSHDKDRDHFDNSELNDLWRVKDDDYT